MLRRRVNELEGELATRPSAPDGPAPGQGRSRWRAVTATTLIVIGCVLAPLAVTSVWASNQVSNTDKYVETVAPLAHDPAVQSAIATQVTREIFTRLDIRSFTTQVINGLSQRNLPPRAQAGLQALKEPIVQGVEGFTRSQVDKFVASPAFATLWDQANRAAHAQLVNLLSGKQGGTVSAQNGKVTLNLAPVIQQVKQRLVARGFSVASNIPVVNKTIVLVQSQGITKAQSAYRLLNTLGNWLPFIALAFVAVGVYVARGHRRALMLGALGIAGSMLVLGVLLAIARPLYLDAVPTDVLPRQAAGNIFDTLVRFLRTGLRTTAVLALVVAAGAFLIGPSSTAVTVRSRSSRAIRSLGNGAESAGFRTGPVGTWTAAHKRALRITVVIAAALTLTFWSQPTVAVVLWTALVTVLVLALVELIGRPAPPVAAEVAGAAAAAPEQPAEPGPVPRQRAGTPGETAGGTETHKETTPHA